MKVLQINSVCGIRSTGRICTDLADTLESRGCECKIAYGRDNVPGIYNKYALRIGNDFDVYFHATMSRIFDMTGFGSRCYTKKFIKWIEEYDPDIIHLHNLHGYYINIKVLFDYLIKAGKPVVWTLHDCWAFTGHCAHFSFVGCNRWQTGCMRCPQKTKYPASYVFDRSKKNWIIKKELFTNINKMIIVTPSHWLAGVVSESFLNKYPIKVIYNGIDTSVFKPTISSFRYRYSLQDKKIILGVASSWSDRKGLNVFIQLSKILDSAYRVIIAGLTKKQIEKMPKNIICIERTNNLRELVEIYSAADVFINPSVEETMGLTTVEAMACGTPVIVSDKTAVPEVVSEKSGLILNDMQINNVVNAIHVVLNGTYDPIINALNYEKSKQYNEYFNLYNSLL